MQGIYTGIPETNYVPREYGVAAILLLLFMVLISLVCAESVVLLHEYFLKYVCSAQYGCFKERVPWRETCVELPDLHKFNQGFDLTVSHPSGHFVIVRDVSLVPDWTSLNRTREGGMNRQLINMEETGWLALGLY